MLLSRRSEFEKCNATNVAQQLAIVATIITRIHFDSLHNVPNNCSRDGTAEQAGEISAQRVTYISFSLERTLRFWLKYKRLFLALSTT
jgi:hypothetical protein